MCAGSHVLSQPRFSFKGFRRYGLTVSTLPQQPIEPESDAVNRSSSASAERRNLADALAHERNVLRTMIDLIPAFIYCKDAQSRFTACNKLVANRMGVDARRADRQDRLRFLPAPRWRRSSSPTSRR